MKHIKVCKPRSQQETKEEKATINNLNEKSMDSKKENSAKGSRFLNEGLGCVPIGNLVGRDS
jgi:hypothetical protein